MMARPLPQWCKNVKIELVRRDMSISDLAKLVGLTKQYTSGIVSGRNYSETAVKNISDALNIPDSPYGLQHRRKQAGAGYRKTHRQAHGGRKLPCPRLWRNQG